MYNVHVVILYLISPFHYSNTDSRKKIMQESNKIVNTRHLKIYYVNVLSYLLHCNNKLGVSNEDLSSEMLFESKYNCLVILHFLFFHVKIMAFELLITVYLTKKYLLNRKCVETTLLCNLIFCSNS